MVYPLTLSNAVAMLLLMPLTVSVNVSVYCRFFFSSVCGPPRSMYVLLVDVVGPSSVVPPARWRWSSPPSLKILVRRVVFGVYEPEESLYGNVSL